ncbi:MAG: ABC transporter substrate-binding protein [Desulfatiglandales bacterium]|nr:ABC transporter substrate-binding protein [Desulfatiglandales bacterium]
MRSKYFYQMILFLILSFTVVAPVWAGGPTEKIKQTTEEIISIVGDPALRDKSMVQERKKLIRKAVDKRFDWEEMGRRALARHWAGRTDEEKREFVSLFGRLMERTYMAKVEGFSGEEVTYEKELVDGEYGVVSVKILTSTDVEIPVKYRLREKGEDWFVYDISIEGVSLVNNYRVQFRNIISRFSYETLVKRLKSKLAKK